MKKLLVLFILIYSFSAFAKEYSDEEIEKFDNMCIEQNKKIKFEYFNEHKDDYKVSDRYKFFCENDAVYEIKPFGKNNEYLLVLCRSIGGLHYFLDTGPDISEDGKPNCDEYTKSGASLAVWKKGSNGVYTDILYKPELTGSEGYDRTFVDTYVTIKDNYFTLEYHKEPLSYDYYYTFREKDGEIYLHRISYEEYVEEENDMKSNVIVDYQYKKGDELINIKEFNGYNNYNGIMYK